MCSVSTNNFLWKTYSKGTIKSAVLQSGIKLMYETAQQQQQQEELDGLEVSALRREIAEVKQR
jgi:hypothetical protein